LGRNFTRPVYRHIIVDALKHCQQQKGLELYAWCLMSNHLHLIAAAAEGKYLTDILRDFKKLTSRTIVEAISKHKHESRRQWMLRRFAFSAAPTLKSPTTNSGRMATKPKNILAV
jgi:putative transposase